MTPTHKIIYLATCSRVIRDLYTQINTYIDVFHQVTIPKDLDYYITTIWVIGKMESSGGELTGEAQILAPNGTVFSKAPLSGTVDPGVVEIAAQFPIARFTETGRYSLQVTVGDVVLGTDNRFYVDVIKQQA